MTGIRTLFWAPRRGPAGRPARASCCARSRTSGHLHVAPPRAFGDALLRGHARRAVALTAMGSPSWPEAASSRWGDLRSGIRLSSQRVGPAALRSRLVRTRRSCGGHDAADVVGREKLLDRKRAGLDADEIVGGLLVADERAEHLLH